MDESEKNFSLLPIPNNKDDNLCYFIFNDIKFIIMKNNNYFNATKILKDVAELCNVKPIRYSNWENSAEIRDTLNAFAKKLGIHRNDLTIKRSSGPQYCTEIRGTYIHPELVTLVAKSLSSEFNASILSWIGEWKNQSDDNRAKYFQALTTISLCPVVLKEQSVRNDIASKYKKSETEVETPVGYIDILTAKKIIEVKEYDLWKSALGQVLSYGRYYKNHKKIIYLFNTNERDISVIKNVCKYFDVKVIVYD